MPAYARRQKVDESVVGVYHCMARCVRRAFLCGFDRYSGRNFDHRKVWVRQRLEELAGIVAVDVLGTPAEPEPHELAMLLTDAEALATRRKRLSSLSWFMASVCEPIARRANREDRFWEGRFRSQAVLDEPAALACSVYIDLNVIRAGLADTPESSVFTGAFERIAARQQTGETLAALCSTVAGGATSGVDAQRAIASAFAGSFLVRPRSPASFL